MNKIAFFNIEDRVMVQSFYHPILPVIKSINPEIKTTALFRVEKNRLSDIEIVERARALKVNFINIEKEMASSELVSLCHANRISVMLWTVNGKNEMHNYLAMGVDGMVTDYPDHLNMIHGIWSGIERFKELAKNATERAIAIPESMLHPAVKNDSSVKAEFIKALSLSLKIPEEAIRIIK